MTPTKPPYQETWYTKQIFDFGDLVFSFCVGFFAGLVALAILLGAST